MVGAGKRVPIKLLPLPTVSGPTSGSTLMGEFSEWRLQARRWTIGAAEVFHFYMVKLLGRNFDVWSGLSYGLSFTLYYGFILCVTGLFQLCAAWGANLNGCQAELAAYELFGSATPFPYVSPNDLFIGLTALKYGLVFGTAFAADVVHRHITGSPEPTLGIAGGVTGSVRSLLHFLSTPLVLIAYNIVEAMAIVELSVRGREICKKDSLTNKNGKKDGKEAEKKGDPTVDHPSARFNKALSTVHDSDGSSDSEELGACGAVGQEPSGEHLHVGFSNIDEIITTPAKEHSRRV